MSESGSGWVARLRAPHVVEALAAWDHAAWAGWMRYLFGRCEKVQSGPWVGCLVMPQEVLDRWRRQVATPYAELSEAEKESDRAEARSLLDALLAELRDE